MEASELVPVLEVEALGSMTCSEFISRNPKVKRIITDICVGAWCEQ
jgi:hypothetical protein